MKRVLQWLGRHWPLWVIPALGLSLWAVYVWRLAEVTAEAPDLPFIYDL